MKDRAPEPPSADERLEAAVGEWRSRHKLKEDDAVLLLLELFRIHQAHWDELRRRELPSFEPLNGQITQLLEAHRSLITQTETLSSLLRRVQRNASVPVVTRTAAWLAALAGTFAGYLLGRAWS